MVCSLEKQMKQEMRKCRLKYTSISRKVYVKLAATFNVEEPSLVWNSFSVCSTVVLALSGFLATAQAAYETKFTARSKQVRLGLDKVRPFFITMSRHRPSPFIIFLG